MQKITPFLWLESQAEEAAIFYKSVFKEAEIVSKMSGPGDSVMSATVRIHNQELILFNGGTHFKLNEAASLFVACDTQEEIDELWEKLSSGGQESRCGWLKDQFGLWWQIIPPVLGEMLQDKNAAKANAVMQAMLKMSKLNIEALKQAYHQTN